MDPRAGVDDMKRKIRTPAHPARSLITIQTTPPQLNSRTFYMSEDIIQLKQKI